MPEKHHLSWYDDDCNVDDDEDDDDDFNSFDDLFEGCWNAF